MKQAHEFQTLGGEYPIAWVAKRKKKDEMIPVSSYVWRHTAQELEKTHTE